MTRQLPLASDPGVLRFRSRAVARQAKFRGEITPQPCACCGNPDAQMHHPDYEEARLIVWLCIEHHQAWHKAQRAALRVLFEGWLALEGAAANFQNDAPADSAVLRDFMGPTPADLVHALSFAAKNVELARGAA